MYIFVCVCVSVGLGGWKKKNMLVCVCVRVFQEQNSNTKRKIIPIHSFQLYTARRDQCGGARSQTRWTQKGKLLFIHVKWHCCFFNIYNLKKKEKKNMGEFAHNRSHTHTHTQTKSTERRSRFFYTTVQDLGKKKKERTKVFWIIKKLHTRAHGQWGRGFSLNFSF